MLLESFQIPERPNSAEKIITHTHNGLEYIFPSAILEILSLDLLSEQLLTILGGVTPHIPRDHQCYRLDLVLATLRDRHTNTVLKTADGCSGTNSTCCLANLEKGLYVCQPPNRTQAIEKILKVNGPTPFLDLYLHFAESECSLTNLADFEVKIAKLLQSGFLFQNENFQIGLVPNDVYIENLGNSKAMKLSASAKNRLFL